ncbi:hypothetical protein JCM19233_4473 [Vibrio astriarenae]|nr:hypothetical protein JCM19233_4473 [Vibrio sp. C7]
MPPRARRPVTAAVTARLDFFIIISSDSFLYFVLAEWLMITQAA